jgi:serine phosphatase RsbU (regulator of sigma subunit)
VLSHPLVRRGRVIGSLISEGSVARERHHWQQEQAERQAQCAPQWQLWEMERHIREEAMSDEDRQRHQQYHQREAEIQREAQRRLGLPEEEADG